MDNEMTGSKVRINDTRTVETVERVKGLLESVLTAPVNMAFTSSPATVEQVGHLANKIKLALKILRDDLVADEIRITLKANESEK